MEARHTGSHRAELDAGQAKGGLAAAMQAAILGFDSLGSAVYLSKLLWSWESLALDAP
jgi:hypothetical protein